MHIALTAWRWMEGRIDWTALPVVVEMLGIEDIEAFLARLLAMREHVRAKSHGQ